MDCIIDHLLYTLYGQEGLVGGGGLVTMMDHCAKYPPSVSTTNTLPGHTATVTTAAGIDTCLQNISMWNIARSFACILVLADRRRQGAIFFKKVIGLFTL